MKKLDNIPLVVLNSRIILLDKWQYFVLKCHFIYSLLSVVFLHREKYVNLIDWLKNLVMLVFKNKV